VRVGAAPSIRHINSSCTKLLDSAPLSSHFLPTTPSPLHAFLGNIKRSHPSFDPCCAYLEDLLRKVMMWNTFLDDTFNFSMAFDKFKRALTVFATSLLVVFTYTILRCML